MTVEFLNLEDVIPPEIMGALNEDHIFEIIQDLAAAARYEWERIAGEELHTSRNDYLNGIQKIVYDEKSGTATIALLGVVPNLVENGMEETHLHDTLLGPNVPVAPEGSPGKRLRKDGGYYRAIPFRHATPGTTGGVGRAMGEPYTGHKLVSDAKALGDKIYDLAKGLTGTVSHPATGVEYGGRLRSPIGGPPIAPKLRPYHATNIYEGMIREEKTYKRRTQSQYVTFRTISIDEGGNKVGMSPWIRPMTEGKRFANRVNEFVQKIAPQAFAAYVEGLK
jgi:hypothetical protein